MTSDLGPVCAAVPSPQTATLRIVELFGPTVQGEGASVGLAVHFLRLYGCNLTCEWCDTAYSWDSSRPDPDRPAMSTTVASVVSELEAQAEPARVRRLVITGGEPLLQRDALLVLCAELKDLGWNIEVETSGTVPPGRLGEFVNQFNVSPKLAHSGVDERARVRLAVLNEFAANPKATFKFVAQQSSDLREIKVLLDQFDVTVRPGRVFIMAEGIDAETVLERTRTLIDAVVAQGWGMTPRWHILLWGNLPGR